MSLLLAQYNNKVKQVYLKHFHIGFAHPHLEGIGSLLHFQAFFYITLISICDRPETHTFSLIMVLPNKQ